VMLMTRRRSQEKSNIFRTARFYDQLLLEETKKRLVYTLVFVPINKRVVHDCYSVTLLTWAYRNFHLHVPARHGFDHFHRMISASFME